MKKLGSRVIIAVLLVVAIAPYAVKHHTTKHQEQLLVVVIFAVVFGIEALGAVAKKMRGNGSDGKSSGGSRWAIVPAGKKGR